MVEDRSIQGAPVPSRRGLMHHGVPAKGAAIGGHSCATCRAYRREPSGPGGSERNRASKSPGRGAGMRACENRAGSGACGGALGWPRLAGDSGMVRGRDYCMCGRPRQGRDKVDDDRDSRVC